MKNVNDLYAICMEEVKAAGIVPGNIVSVTINTRAKKRWGQCKRLSNGTYTINISNSLMADNVSINAAKNTMAHEILHTVKGCMNHGPEWQTVADKMNRIYPDIYNIKRTTSAEEKGLEGVGRVRNEEWKCKLVCQKCKGVHYYKRESKTVRNYHNYHCGKCGGKFTLEYL